MAGLDALSLRLHHLLRDLLREAYRRGWTRRGVRQWRYWERRRDYGYYRVARRWIEELGPGRTIVDVGGSSSATALAGSFESRIVVDRRWILDRKPGLRYVRRDYLRYPIRPAADVVTCLQVLEHLADDVVQPFARKLLAEGTHVIVSVPHEWPAGLFPVHLQDPVDRAKLLKWLGRPPEREEIVRDGGRDRLVALFRGSPPPR